VNPVASLELLMTYRADLGAPIEVGAVPTGQRRIFDVVGGHFEGARLRGRLRASGGDWLLVGSDGVGRLDVRGTFETHDGALIYGQYTGVLVFNEAVLQALARGGETRYGDTYFITQPRFETGHPDYAWLNSTLAVGEGRVLPSAVEYRVYAIVGSPAP
jgi:hypothetical protein